MRSVSIQLFDSDSDCGDRAGMESGGGELFDAPSCVTTVFSRDGRDACSSVSGTAVVSK
jgi:hypothetical protein